MFLEFLALGAIALVGPAPQASPNVSYEDAATALVQVLDPRRGRPEWLIGPPDGGASEEDVRVFSVQSGTMVERCVLDMRLSRDGQASQFRLDFRDIESAQPEGSGVVLDLRGDENLYGLSAEPGHDGVLLIATALVARHCRPEQG